MQTNEIERNLTRYLYRFGDVEASLVEAILKNNIINTLFWISELFLSGYISETKALLEQIYYDYFYIHYSQIEKKVFLETKKELTLEWHLQIGKMLCSLKKKSTFSLELRLLSKIRTLMPNYVYRKIPSHLNDYVEPRLVQSIEHGHIQNTAYFIGKKDFTRYHDDLVKLIKVKKRITHENHIACIAKHIYMKRFRTLKINRLPKPLLSNLSKSEKEFLEKANTPPKSNPCTILAKYQLVPIVSTQLAAPFPYEPDQWQYDAFNTPIWNERFIKYRARQNHQEKTVEFETEDDEEAFCQLYAYEPDEHPVRFLSNAAIPVTRINYSDWLIKIFE